jgi:hypothetical protein
VKSAEGEAEYFHARLLELHLELSIRYSILLAN